MHRILKSLTNKFWDANFIQNNINVDTSDIIKQIFLSRNLSIANIDSFMDAKIKYHMENPFLLKDMELACELLYNAFINNQSILIFGDYDVDGISSTVILTRYLKQLGFKVNYYIPDRYTQGYGLSLKSINSVFKFKPDLLITVDNGSSSLEEVKLIKQNNIKVLIVDHHDVGNVFPSADAFINPKRHDDISSNNHLCAAGITFLLMVAFNKYIKDKKLNITEINLMEYLGFVAMATLCDVVPLLGLNRAYVNQGIKVFNRGNNQAIQSLLSELSINQVIDENTIGYSLGAAINASSRMGNNKIPMELFLSEDIQEIKTKARTLVLLNKERQKEELKIINGVIYELEKQEDKLTNESIFIGSKLWKSGIIGIVAGRLKDNYGKPACVFFIDESQNIGTASGRSIVGIDLGKIIIQAKHKGLLLKGGGHSQAVGFSFSLDKKNELENFINQAIAKQKVNNSISDDIILKVDAPISIKDITPKTMREINQLRPFGASFPEPIFLLENVYLTNIKRMGTQKNHLRCDILDLKANKIQGICYKAYPSILGDYISSYEGKVVDLIINLNESFFRGNHYINCYIKDILEKN